MTDSTTPAAAAALLKTAAFKAVEFEGRILTARVIEDGTRDVIVKVGGKNRWAKTPAYFMLFEGGKWGSHRLALDNSSPERLAAHWDGYIVAHQQDADRRAKLAQVPAGTRYVQEEWVVKAGDRCFFSRGMYGRWEGKVLRVYEARGYIGVKKGTKLVDIACKGANGRSYTYKRVLAASLTKNGVRPYLPLEA